MNLKEENEKLRGLLRLSTDRWESWASEIIHTTPEYESELAEIARIRAALSQQAEPAPAQNEREAEVPPMPETEDRRPYVDSEPDGYLEGNRDWAEANDDAVEWLADNHRAIRAALAHPVKKVNVVDTPEQQPHPRM